MHRNRFLFASFLFAATRLAGFLLFGNGDDIRLYHGYSTQLRNTSLSAMYDSEASTVEYPQLSLLLFAAAGHVAELLPPGTEKLVLYKTFYDQTAEESRFQIAFGLLLFLVDLALFVSLGRSFASHSETASAGDLLLRYTIAGLLFSALLYSRTDLIVGATAFAAFAAVRTNRFGRAYAILAVGAAFKLVPLLLVPVVVLSAIWVDRDRRPWARILIRQLALAVPIFALWPILAFAFGGGVHSFDYLRFHANRGLEIGSSYAWPALGLDPQTSVVHEFRSISLRGPFADRMAAASSLVLIVGLIAAYALLGSVVRKHGQTARAFTDAGESPTTSFPTLGMLLVWLVFMLFSKVGSPQYALWLIPFIPYMSRPIWWSFFLLCVTYSVSYPWLFPHIMGELVPGTHNRVTGPTTIGYLLLISRTCSLVLLIIFVVRQLTSIARPARID